jgi:hypothetical protein
MCWLMQRGSSWYRIASLAMTSNMFGSVADFSAAKDALCLQTNLAVLR